jgi:DNA-binding NtrC family response regulator
VRELDNGVKRLAVLSENIKLTKELLIQCLCQQSKYEKKPLRERVADYERGEIVQTLGAVKNLTGKYDLNTTAKLLGTHVETLKDMIERYEIKLENYKTT